MFNEFEKKKVYLSELFLDELNEDFSANSVMNALWKCNNELLLRLSKGIESEHLINYLFCKKKYLPSYIEQEFTDFIDVYIEFDNIIEPYQKSKLLILQ